MLGLLETQTTLRLQIEHIELQLRVERRPVAPGAIGNVQNPVEHGPERLEIDDLHEFLQRIALR